MSKPDPDEVYRKGTSCEPCGGIGTVAVRTKSKLTNYASYKCSKCNGKGKYIK